MGVVGQQVMDVPEDGGVGEGLPEAAMEPGGGVAVAGLDEDGGDGRVRHSKQAEGVAASAGPGEQLQDDDVSSWLACGGKGGRWRSVGGVGVCGRWWRFRRVEAGVWPVLLLDEWTGFGQ